MSVFFDHWSLTVPALLVGLLLGICVGRIRKRNFQATLMNAKHEMLQYPIQCTVRSFWWGIGSRVQLRFVYTLSAVSFVGKREDGEKYDMDFSEWWTPTWNYHRFYHNWWSEETFIIRMLDEGQVHLRCKLIYDHGYYRYSLCIGNYETLTMHLEKV